eukprot:7720279-Ditylum_brightwellii.AAC.1
MEYLSDKEKSIAGGIVIIDSPGDRDSSKENCCALLGFLETPTPSHAYMILREVKKSESIYSPRILLASDDCPSHEFGNFEIYRANPKAEDEVDLETEGPVNVVSNIMKALSK